MVSDSGPVVKAFVCVFVILIVFVIAESKGMASKGSVLLLSMGRFATVMPLQPAASPRIVNPLLIVALP